jgi:peptidoglycan hydrolase-like protein with peptidoglycan-binding domain
VADRVLRLTRPYTRGQDVLDLQSALNHLGHNPGPLDGIFGPRTEAAVRRFQQAVGVAVDGIYGPVSRGAMGHALAGPPPTVLTVDPVHYFGGALPGVIVDRNDVRLGALQQVGEAVVGATVDLSTDEVSQCTITVNDPTGEFLIRSHFNLNNRVGIAGLDTKVAAREVTTVGRQPGLSVTLRSRGGQELKHANGALIRRDISPTGMMAAEAAYWGLRFIGEPSPARAQVVRATADPKVGGQNESSWSMGQRLARELGYWFFESMNTLYFGRPTWLAQRMPMREVTWAGRAAGALDRGLEAPSSDFVLAVPSLRDSADDPGNGATGTVSMHPEAARWCVPGSRVFIHGMGPFSGEYIVTRLNMDLGKVKPATVSVARPRDPRPEGEAATA